MIFQLALFVEAGEVAAQNLGGSVNLPSIFFLQLLLLVLLIFAFSEPVFTIRPTNIAIILDNSASMQALEDGKADSPWRKSAPSRSSPNWASAEKSICT